VGGETVRQSCTVGDMPLTRAGHRKHYHEIKDEWCGVPEVFDRSDILEVSVSVIG
jgi:hypothetical protein